MSGGLNACAYNGPDYVADYSMYMFPRTAEVLEKSALTSFCCGVLFVCFTPLVGLVTSLLTERAWRICLATGVILMVAGLGAYLLFKGIELLPQTPKREFIPLAEVV